MSSLDGHVPTFLYAFAFDEKRVFLQVTSREHAGGHVPKSGLSSPLQAALRHEDAERATEPPRVARRSKRRLESPEVLHLRQVREQRRPRATTP